MSAPVQKLWTSTEDEILREMWPDEHNSASIIGNRIGRTKNSVIGRVHRLDLPGRVSPIKGFCGTGRKRRGRDIPMTTLVAYLNRSTPAGEAVPSPSAPAVTARVPSSPRAEAVPPLASLDGMGEPEGAGRPCQWPLWGWGKGKIAERPTGEFCGQRAVLGRPYCSAHHVRSIIPRAERLVDKGRLERLAAAE